MKNTMTMLKQSFLFAVFTAFLLPDFAGYAGDRSTEPALENLPITIVRGEINYNWQDKIVEIESGERGDPSVFFGDIAITAKSIRFNEQTGIVDASGDVRLWDGGIILQGDTMTYNLADETGALTNLKRAELTPNIYFTGERLEIRQVAAKTPKDATEPVTNKEYLLFNGTATTNDLPYPFYYLEFSKTRIIPNVRFWVNDVVFYSNSIPLMYAPLMTKTLRDHVVTFYFNADYDSDLGFSLSPRLQIKPGDEWSVDFYGDYFTKAGIGKGAKFQFDVPGDYGPKGMLYGYHIEQEAPDNDFLNDGDDRYNFALEYMQDLPYDMRLSAKGHKISDSEYRWDYRRPEEVKMIDVESLQHDTVSSLSLSKWWDDQSLRVTAASRLDSFYYSGLPFVEREPQVHFEQYPLNLFDSGVYTDFQLDYGRYRREEGVTFPLDKYDLFDRTTFIDEIDRFDSELKFEYPISFPNWVTFKPWLGYRATYYGDPSREVDDPNQAGYQIRSYEFDSETRSMPEGGLEISSRSTYEFDPFLSRYDKMRAVVEPVLSYGYYHPSADLEEIVSGPDIRFPYIDPVDDYRFKMHRVSALLRSKIQGKSGSMTSDFMRLSAGAVYDYLPDDNLRFDNFQYFDDPFNNRDHRYSDLVQNFAIFPYNWISFGDALRYDVDDDELRSQYYYTTVKPLDPIDLTVGYYTYRHPALDAGEQEDITFNVNWAVSKKWDLYFTGWYDLDESYFRRNYVGLVRDLYDFYAMIEVGYRDHPTLGEDVSIHVGFGFWGLGGKKANPAPLRFH